MLWDVELSVRVMWVVENVPWEPPRAALGLWLSGVPCWLLTKWGRCYLQPQFCSPAFLLGSHTRSVSRPCPTEASSWVRPLMRGFLVSTLHLDGTLRMEKPPPSSGRRLSWWDACWVPQGPQPEPRW